MSLIGYDVHVVSYSKYLSERDYNDFKNLFKFLEIENKISYGTFRDLIEKFLNEKGDIRVMTK